MNPLFCSIQGRKRVLKGILGRTRGEQTPINADNTYLVPNLLFVSTFLKELKKLDKQLL